MAKIGRTAGNGRFKRTLQTVHLWMGLLLAIPIIVIGLSGSALLLQREILAYSVPAASADGEHAPLMQMIAAAEKAAPENTTPQKHRAVAIRGRADDDQFRHQRTAAAHACPCRPGVAGRAWNGARDKPRPDTRFPDQGARVPAAARADRLSDRRLDGGRDDVHGGERHRAVVAAQRHVEPCVLDQKGRAGPAIPSRIPPCRGLLGIDHPARDGRERTLSRLSRDVPRSRSRPCCRPETISIADEREYAGGPSPMHADGAVAAALAAVPDTRAINVQLPPNPDLPLSCISRRRHSGPSCHRSW